MGLFDWLGPLNAGSKRRGWDALPSVRTEQKLIGTLEDYGAALTVRTLVHGPGATDLMRGQRGNDNNSAVYACLSAIATAIAEPELTVYKIRPGERVEQANTPLGTLLRRPNPHLSMDTLLAYLSNCLHVDGNAYWRKLRSGNELTGNVVELWPISPTRIEPKTTRGSGDFVSFYRYHLGPGRYEDIDPVNIVHFPLGIDDADHRVGCAPLKRLLREVSSDEQATRYADRLLGNFATPGLSVEWSADMKELTKAQAAEVKDRLQAAYGGDNVGAISVLSPGAKLVSHGFSPEQMDMKTLHRVPEERIAAVLGVPAIVAGLGAGLDHATYSNVAQAREAFTEMKCIPLWRSLGATITMALAPDFTSDQSIVVDFNIDDVRALQGDENAKATRLNTLVMGAQITLNEARTEQGLEPIAGGDVLLIPGAWAPTPPAHLAALAAAPPPAAPTAAPAPAPVALPSTRSRRLALPQRQVKAAGDLPGSLDALKEDAEAAWRRMMLRFLEAQSSRAISHLHAGGTSADDLIVEAEATLLGEVLSPLQMSVLSDVHRLVVSELGIEFGLDDPQTRAYLERAGSNIVGITDHTRERVAAALIEGQEAGEGISELARRLRDLPAFGQARATVVARTELANATTLSAVSSYIASGVVVGCRVLDSDADPACAAVNGRTFPLDKLPPTLGHPNCLVGGSLVLAPNIQATFARWFDGEVIVLRTAADDLLTCTPNHPILTGRGWVAAGALAEGDYIFRSLDSERMARWLDPDRDQVPTRIEQIVGTAWPAGTGYAAAVPCTAEDFHGDAVDGEVCVVRADRFRKGDVLRLMTQHRSKLLVEGRYPEEASLPGLGSFAELLMATSQTAHGSVSSLSLPAPFAWGHSGSQHLVGLTAGSHGVTTVLEPPPNARPSDAERSADLFGALAGLIAPVQIVSVDRRQFSGHVYNLETSLGWYVADNIITHNCVRAMAPIVDASEMERSA